MIGQERLARWLFCLFVFFLFIIGFKLVKHCDGAHLVISNLRSHHQWLVARARGYGLWLRQICRRSLWHSGGCTLTRFQNHTVITIVSWKIISLSWENSWDLKIILLSKRWVSVVLCVSGCQVIWRHSASSDGRLLSLCWRLDHDWNVPGEGWKLTTRGRAGTLLTAAFLHIHVPTTVASLGTVKYNSFILDSVHLHSLQIKSYSSEIILLLWLFPIITMSIGQMQKEHYWWQLSPIDSTPYS